MLLLRKECQPLLDTAGLDNLHVEVQDKCLVLVGECGKPLVNIKGITFTKPTINTAERSYALELFNNFIIKYKADIIAYITTKKAFMLITRPALTGNYKTQITSPSYGQTGMQYSVIVSFPDTKHEVKIKDDSVDFMQCKITFDELATIHSVIAPHIPIYVKWIADITAYLETEKSLQAQAAQLAACDI